MNKAECIKVLEEWLRFQSAEMSDHQEQALSFAIAHLKKEVDVKAIEDIIYWEMKKVTPTHIPNLALAIKELWEKG